MKKEFPFSVWRKGLGVEVASAKSIIATVRQFFKPMKS
jgi:hypothetical protein